MWQRPCNSASCVEARREGVKREVSGEKRRSSSMNRSMLVHTESVQGMDSLVGSDCF